MNNQKAQVKNSNPAESRLIGWLVSYAMNEKGKAYELRAGRYLITNENTEDQRTITIEEESVSSPHVAMNASAKHTLQIQDIFSDSGTFLIKADSGQEIPVTGPVTVNHGDWLRIGEKTRFQVCLIDGPGR